MKYLGGEEVGASWGSNMEEGWGQDRWEKQLGLSACVRFGNSGSDKETERYNTGHSDTNINRATRKVKVVCSRLR